MTSTRILVVQLADMDPPARLGEWLVAAGADLDIRHAATEPIPADAAALTESGYAAVVVLGGPMGAYDDLDHPWLADVRRLLSACVATALPLLAICLGAQLLAVATGGVVEVGRDGPEVGPKLVAKRDVGWVDPLFADLPLMPDVFHFHSDAVVRLPANGALLVSSLPYANQGFRIGACGYGIQFHIETTPEMVRSWADNHPETAALAKPGELSDERLAEMHADIEETWRPFTERFVRLAKGELAPAEPSRPQLPVI